MTWFKVDDKFHDHPKARKAGRAAVGLWLMAGSWCADNLTDGFVPDDVLPRWGGRDEDVWGDADRLVSVRLWERVERDGDSGYVFLKWAKYQPTRADVMRKRAEARDRMARVRANITRSSGEVQGDVRSTPSRPVPSRPESVVTSSRQSLVSTARETRLTDDDLDRIAAKTGGDHDHASRVAADVLDRASSPPRKPLAYVLRAIAAEPDRYRMAFRLTKDTQCPTHPGQPADNCGGCAADRREVK